MFVNKNENNSQQISMYSFNVNTGSYFKSCPDNKNFKNNSKKNFESNSKKVAGLLTNNNPSEDKENQPNHLNLSITKLIHVKDIKKSRQPDIVRSNQELIKNYIENLDKSLPEITENSIIIQEKLVRPNGEIQSVNYVVGKCIGKGGFAKCYELINLDTKHTSAVKVVQKYTMEKSRARAKLISEIKIHRSLQNEHIVKFEHYFEDENNVYLLLEICKNQTLNDLLKRRKRLTEFEVAYYTNHIVEALKYLHSNKIIHRDVKLGNLFLTDKMQLKLGDFGLATKLEYEGERKRTVCGTPNYLAPEILQSKNGHSYEIDIWGLGVIIFTLLVGKPPFESVSVKQTYERIKNNDYKIPDKIQLSPAAVKLIKDILVNDPSARPSLDEIKASEFLNANLPLFLPTSTLVLPPSAEFLKKYEKTEFFKNDICSEKINDTILININHKFSDLVGNNINFKKKKVVIEKFLDFSSKYGLTYILNNGSIGVYYNDTTKIVLDHSGDIFHYLEKKEENKIEVMSIFRIDNYPDYLNKKVTLLNYFKEMLTEKKTHLYDQVEKSNITDSHIFVYLKKWLRTKCATIFRLSNKICQIIFNDQTQILLCSETKQVTYINRMQEEETHFLANAMESKNMEMIKRLQYTREVLTCLMNRKKDTEERRENN